VGVFVGFFGFVLVCVGFFGGCGGFGDVVLFLLVGAVGRGLEGFNGLVIEVYDVIVCVVCCCVGCFWPYVYSCFLASGDGGCWFVYDDVLVRFVVLLFFL